ncbi:sensor histidine kinase [Pseudonocardia hydrocarbonoxydans]|uniref:histidine kinase n=1 Tax=Pseudonocardia hydrocarbonoxydans TaxID=76726 RepID=A0A4Y3WM66_9PSEU|nr:HAMP domain-containing sensor histidine kinase [Pseudonocardia hydrocarbonoxydans]GEC19150.1 two-component sensor histidine kinase [Pseudonocardia hydrocarbonoxydans]
MRNRIVLLTVIISIVAISLFALPLAVVAQRFYTRIEIAELERSAHLVVDDIADKVRDGEVPAPEWIQHDVTAALYDPAGRKLTGDGPLLADRTVREAAEEGYVDTNDDSGDLVVAIPISEDGELVGVLRATTPRAEATARIVERWLQMLALAAVVLLVTLVVARRQAARLAQPVEDLARAALRLGDGDFTTEERVVGIVEIDEVRSALNATAGRLDALIARERAFSAEASHQLRTPLTGLQLRLEAALRSDRSDHTAAIHASLAEVDRLERTITDLLALARGTRQRGALDLPALLHEVDQVWGPRLGSRGRALRFDVDADLPVVEASTAAIRQVLTVLLGNAVEHGRGTVTVGVHDIDEAVRIDITDEGRVATEAGPDLFDRREPDADGHGIGLALARRLAEAEGGRLQLTSPAPTTLTAFLPTGTPSEPAAVAPATAS